MAKLIFISYRRDDSGGYAGRVQDRMVKEFGPEVLFMDVDGIPLGANFVKILQQRVSACNVLLAMIGPHWLDAQDEQGNRRLDNPNDYVRIEIAAALQRDIPVVPILLEGTKIPHPDKLPEEIRELSLRSGLDVRLASFHGDCDRLIQGLKKQFDINAAPEGANPQVDAPPQNARPKDAPPEDASSKTQIRAGVLAWVGGIGALLSLAVLVTLQNSLSISEVGGTRIDPLGSLIISPVTYAFCGAITGLITPRYGIQKAAAITTGLKFLLSIFGGFLLGNTTVVFGHIEVALFSAGWFGISILGIMLLYEWTQRRLPLGRS